MFKAPSRKDPTIGLTPLIDIVFILLIFVVLAANFDRIQGLKVALPEASQSQSSEKNALNITINKRGDIFVQQRLIPAEKLLATLQKLRHKFQILLVRADHQVAFQHAVRVLDQASKVGFASVSIATKRESLP